VAPAIGEDRTGAASAHPVRQYGPPHLPLNRQSAVYARAGTDLDLSTLAD